MSVEQWWNDTDRGKLKYWQKDLSMTIGTWTVSEVHGLFALSERRLTYHHGVFKSCFAVTRPVNTAA